MGNGGKKHGVNGRGTRKMGDRWSIHFFCSPHFPGTFLFLPRMLGLMNCMGSNIVVTYGKSKGLNPGAAHVLDDMLTQAGAVNISSRRVAIPLNHGGKLGDLFWYASFRHLYSFTYAIQYSTGTTLKISLWHCTQLSVDFTVIWLILKSISDSWMLVRLNAVNTKRHSIGIAAVVKSLATTSKSI